MNNPDIGELEAPSPSIFQLDCTSSTHHSTIHFSGANGFPVEVYRSFLQQFCNQHRVTAADCRATSQQVQTIPKRFGFADFANDLIQIIEQQHQNPVIGMGHSFGAHVTLIAAIKRPDLFNKLVLIEPASLPSAALDLVYRRLPEPVLHKMLPMIKKTQQRQRVWPDRATFIEKYRHHRTFRQFTEQALNAYAQHGLRQRDDDQFELVFAPEWEAHIFRKVEFVWKNLKRCHVPCLFIRAQNSNLYSSALFNRENTKLGKHFTGLEIANTHHLMPLESPQLCHQSIENWLLAQ